MRFKAKTLAVLLAFFSCAAVFGHAIIPLIPPLLTGHLNYPDLRSTDRVLFIGDSITALGFNGQDSEGPGWGDQFFQLAQAQRPGIRFIGNGIGGNRTLDIVNRIESSIEIYNPTVVVVWVGLNDIDTNIPLEQIGINFGRIVGTCSAHSSIREIVLVSSLGNGEARYGTGPVDAQINELANYLFSVTKLKQSQGNTRIFYCPMRDYFCFAEAAFNPFGLPNTFLRIDHLHPNQRGMGLIRQVMSRVFGIYDPNDI